MAAARNWPEVYSNAVDPGWVPTKMGGPGAPDDLQKGFETQVRLAESEDDGAKVTGQYLHHQQQDRYLHQADYVSVQEKFLSICEKISGVSFPVGPN